MKPHPSPLVFVVLALALNGCNRNPPGIAGQPSTAQISQPAAEQKASITPKAYAELSHDELVRIAQQRLQLPEPPSLGAGITITPRQPSVANVASLYMWRGSVFNPYLDAAESGAGQDVTVPKSDFRFGIFIRPTPGRATLIHCSIYGVTTLVYFAEVFTASGSYIGDNGDSTITQPQVTTDWTILVPWDPQFADFGMFRLMLVPTVMQGAILTGCQIAPVL